MRADVSALFTVSQFYQDFGEAADDDVRPLLDAAFRPPPP